MEIIYDVFAYKQRTRDIGSVSGALTMYVAAERHSMSI